MVRCTFIIIVASFLVMGQAACQNAKMVRKSRERGDVEQKGEYDARVGSVITNAVKKKYSTNLMLTLAKASVDSNNAGIVDSARILFKELFVSRSVKNETKDELMIISDLFDSCYALPDDGWKTEMAVNVLALKYSYAIHEEQPEVFDGVTEHLFSTVVFNNINKPKRDSCNMVVRTTGNIEKIDKNFRIYIAPKFFKDVSDVQVLRGQVPEMYPIDRVANGAALRQWLEDKRRKAPGSIHVFSSAEYDDKNLVLVTDRLSNAVMWHLYLFMNGDELKFHTSFKVCEGSREMKVIIDESPKAK